MIILNPLESLGETTLPHLQETLNLKGSPTHLLVPPLLSELAQELSSIQTLNEINQKARALETKTKNETQITLSRLKHAKELLGNRYPASIIQESLDNDALINMNQNLFLFVQQHLKGHWKDQSQQISKTLISESEKYHFDPAFLVALIQTESSFRPDALGSAGEIGLMQLTPNTAEWIAKKSNLPWKGTASLRNPITNIQIGAAYISYLRERFEYRSQLYITAYNMGATQLRKAIERRTYPREYASRIMQSYIHFYAMFEPIHVKPKHSWSHRILNRT